MELGRGGLEAGGRAGGVRRDVISVLVVRCFGERSSEFAVARRHVCE